MPTERSAQRVFLTGKASFEHDLNWFQTELLWNIRDPVPTLTCENVRTLSNLRLKDTKAPTMNMGLKT